MNQSTIIVSPVHRSKDYAMNRFIQNVATIRGAEMIVLVDTTKDGYINELWDMARATGQVDRFAILEIDQVSKIICDNITAAMNKAREFVLNLSPEIGYDMMCIECDLFPPDYTIDRLQQHGKKVVGFPYFVGWGIRSLLCINHVRTRMITLDRLCCINTVVNPFDSFFLMNGKLIKVHGMGLGCTLISNEVLKQIPFMNLGNAAHDTFFYEDLFKNQVEVFCDTSMIIEHDNKKWNHYSNIFKS